MKLCKERGDSMNWLREKLETFMIGRNGADPMSHAFVAAGLLLYVIYLFTGKAAVNWCSSAFLLYALFRMFSQNTEARTRKNAVFLRYIQYGKTKWQCRKTHKVFLCKKCGRIIRVPKGKGRIEVTCPVCRTTVVIRS